MTCHENPGKPTTWPHQDPSLAVQSSLSDSVSYCAESSGAGSRSQILFCWWAAWFTDEGAHAIGVGGVLLSIRIVRGL